jgi:hypothetical protein
MQDITKARGEKLVISRQAPEKCRLIYRMEIEVA